MFKALQETIMAEYSGQRAKNDVAEIIQFHRIQASPGLRAAAHSLCRKLEEMEIAAEVLSYPANDRTSYWGSLQFQEWEATAGTLHLVAPEDQARKLADYSESKTALIQRSAPVKDWQGEVVLLEDGEEQAEYEGLDVAGKLVMTRGDIDRVRELAVTQRGAAGILFDGMHEQPPVYERIDHPDLLRYTSFWWRPGDRLCWGFVVSPRVGEQLRKLIKSRRAEGKPALQFTASVASRLYDGELEVLSALIPGQTDDEVVLVAHQCHPQPSANDNGSGSAALVEMARTLSRLLKEGVLARPRRGIRLLWVPEMTGSFAYLASNPERIPHMVAGVNLDMVGENQEACGSVFVIESPPAAMASFAPDLLVRMREELLTGAKSPGGSASYAPFRHAVTPFSGGSDHYVFSDPSVGVPMPMLIQWPDKYWHTSGDTLDKVDARMLGIIGGLATTYAYFLANAGDAEARWLGQEMSARFRARLARDVQAVVTDALVLPDAGKVALSWQRLERQMTFLVDRCREAMATLLRLAPGETSLVQGLQDDTVQAGAAELARVRGLFESRIRELGGASLVPPAVEPSEWDLEAATWVPERKFPGPVAVGAHMSRLGAEDREKWRKWLKEHRVEYGATTTQADYWVDGRRSVAEIVDLVECETGLRCPEVLVEHFHLLEQLGLMELRHIQPRAA
ncbi:MAG TPA: DUF4910 domain-containing protein [Anaerolineae bacterium]|nr:DUF4910 domain-containing protein [Anaerolineae bacterium]